MIFLGEVALQVGKRLMAHSFCCFCLVSVSLVQSPALPASLFSLSHFIQYVFSHFVAKGQTDMYSDKHLHATTKCWNVFGVDLLLMCFFPPLNNLLYWLSFTMTAVLLCFIVRVCVCPCVQSLMVSQCGNLPVATPRQTLTVLLTEELF